MTDYIKKLESKVKDCGNTNTIFDTRKYVLLEDAKQVLSQALNIPVVSDSQRLKNYDEGYKDGYGDACINKPMRKDLGVY